MENRPITKLFGSLSHKPWASLYNIYFLRNLFGKNFVEISVGFTGSPKQGKGKANPL
jgi:hypothetical protein